MESSHSLMETLVLVAELKREHTCWEHVEGTHWEARFSHLLNYGAAYYYSYLYAKCFAATIWKKLCQEDPLSLTTGFALRTKFLQHGGARDPASLLNDLYYSLITLTTFFGISPRTLPSASPRKEHFLSLILTVYSLSRLRSIGSLFDTSVLNIGAVYGD
ncbi:Mitochondrial intermediate peptidase [Stylosanthes scabra]|uniref:Mitochondrial intermediate peptidase n=1 Tax=Stylosanthes scabra TaxID=79078 RepID=A0ABU6SCW9_9FABA|nr:Mitochondrial intermediate peptidase [Stylosanthes scabra]